MDPTSGEETSGDVAEWISREIVGNQLADFKVEDYSRINELEIGETQFHSQQPEAQQWRTMKPFDHMTPSSGLESARRKMETESEPQERVDNIDPDRLHSRLPLLPILPEIEEGDDEFDWDDQTLPSSRRLSKSSTLFDGLESDPLLIFSSDGFRKKSARFEIPQERNLENIDALIASTNDEQEKKELKQQKRLLRNRQAALDSRQRRKTHTEKLEMEKKEWLAEKEELENTITYFRDSTQSLSAAWRERREEYETLLREVTNERDEAIRTKALETAELTRGNNVLEDSVRDLKRQLNALVDDTRLTATSDAMIEKLTTDPSEPGDSREAEGAGGGSRGFGAGHDGIVVMNDPLGVGTHDAITFQTRGSLPLLPQQMSNMKIQDRDWGGRASKPILDAAGSSEDQEKDEEFDVMSSFPEHDSNSTRDAPVDLGGRAAEVRASSVGGEGVSVGVEQKGAGDEDSGVISAGSEQPSSDASHTPLQPAAGARQASRGSCAKNEDSVKPGFVEVSISTTDRDPEEAGPGTTAPTSTNTLDAEICHTGIMPAWPALESPALPREHTLDSLAKAEWNLDSDVQAGKTRKAFASGQQSGMAGPGRVRVRHSPPGSLEKLIERSHTACREAALDVGIVICSVAIGKLLVALGTPEPWRLLIWENFLGATTPVMLSLVLLWLFPDGGTGSSGGGLWHASAVTPVIAMSAAVTIVLKLLILIVVQSYKGSGVSSDLYWTIVLLVALARLSLGQRSASVRTKAPMKALPWTVSLLATAPARELDLQQLNHESIDQGKTAAIKLKEDATTQPDVRRSLEDRSSRQPISWSPTSAHTYDPVNASNDVDPVTNGAADGFVATYQQIRRGPLLSLKALLAFCKDCLCFPMARWDHGTRGTLARLRMMLEPAISADRVRIRFVCFCGKAVWEDYPKDLEPQARNLERRLDRHFREVESRAGEDRKPYGFRHFIGRVVSDLKYFSNWLNRKLSGEQRDSKVDAESQEPDTVSATVQEGPYYLTSFPSPGDRRPRLAQVAASEIQGDQAYFAMLRAKARAIQRRWINILVPRKVKAINYVRMYLLHDNEHVDVFQSVEPQFPKDEDEYSPVETQLQEAESLYLGSNTLLHFFEKEHDCCAYPHALFAIPKKLRGKLSVPERGRPMIGWGMRLVDGIDTFRLGLNGFAGLLASSMVGIIWARLHHDVQGGSGISQCLMYFVTFVVTMHGVAEIR